MDIFSVNETAGASPGTTTMIGPSSPHMLTGDLIWDVRPDPSGVAQIRRKPNRTLNYHHASVLHIITTPPLQHETIPREYSAVPAQVQQTVVNMTKQPDTSSRITHRGNIGNPIVPPSQRVRRVGH